MEQEFENYWNLHRKQLIDAAPSKLTEERKRSLGLNTAADWLLIAFPVIVMVVLMDYDFVNSPIINFIIVLIIGVITLVLGQMISPYVTGKRRITDIDNDIKQYYYNKYKRTGKLGTITGTHGNSK